MLFSRIVVYSICTLYCSFAFASTSFEMPSLPLSVFADTEISSNLLNPEWNLVRIVVRGGNKPGESIKSIFFPHPFVLRLM